MIGKRNTVINFSKDLAESSYRLIKHGLSFKYIKLPQEKGNTFWEQLAVPGILTSFCDNNNLLL